MAMVHIPYLDWKGSSIQKVLILWFIWLQVPTCKGELHHVQLHRSSPLGTHQQVPGPPKYPPKKWPLDPLCWDEGHYFGYFRVKVQMPPHVRRETSRPVTETCSLLSRIRLGSKSFRWTPDTVGLQLLLCSCRSC